MDLEFIIVQGIGLLAWILLVISYYRENTNKILILQVIATILYCVHYYLLGAWSGLFICCFEVIRDYGYYKTDWDNYIFLASIPIYIIYGVLSFETIFDIMPIFSSFIDGLTLTMQKKFVVIGAIVSYLLWVIYDLAVGSYSCAITDGIVTLSNIGILIFDKELFKTPKKKGVHRQKKYSQ